MVQVSAEEAKTQLPELIAEAIRGETIFIREGEHQLVQLVPVAEPQRRPQFGSARGLITMSDDFDEPLEDFAEYTP